MGFRMGVVSCALLKSSDVGARLGNYQYSGPIFLVQLGSIYLKYTSKLHLENY